MKKRLSFIMLILVAVVVTAGAQNHDKRMKQIRQAYADRLEMMKIRPYGEDMPFNEASVDVAKNLPGTGLYERHDKFYFTQEQYSADGSMCSQLYFMTSKETYVMGIHIWYWEFLWDSMEGDPMFALLVRQEGDSKQEFRFYFENGKVIKVVPEVKKWPSIDDDLSIAPFKSPADVLSLMNAKQELFKTLVNE